jgi:small conductance mechanosensitive channel
MNLDLDPQHAREAATELLTTYGFNALGALIILLVGAVLARYLPRWVTKLCHKTPRIDDTLTPFFSSIVRIIVWGVTILLVLDQVGVDTTGLLAMFGALGLGIGLALKDTLSDLAAGIILLILRPFSVGDFVEAGGAAGTVTEISFFSTRMKSLEGTFILIPNSKVWGDVIHNKTVNPTRRIEITLRAAYREDVDRVLDIVREEIAKDPRVLSDPEPFIALNNLGENAQDLIVRVWTATTDWGPAQFDLRKALKRRLDAEGVEIPFPQRDVRVVWEGPGSIGTAANPPEPSPEAPAGPAEPGTAAGRSAPAR